MSNNEILTLNEDVQNYFDDIKDKVNEVDLKTIENNLKEITLHIEKAEKLGQVSLARELRNQTALIVNEKRLLNYGINKYVFMEDIVRYIESIKGHVIKFCELEHFPRVIPNHISDKILECKENKLFDHYYILFTDYINQELITDKQKKERKVNKDPIIFGEFNFYPKRYFVIADWEDEYCDITFDKFVDQLTNIDKNYKPNEIIEDNEIYINKVLELVRKEQQNKKNNQRDLIGDYIAVKKSKNGLFNWLKRIFK